MSLPMIVHAVTATLLTAMAVLQLNDPDPLLWFVVYLCAAAMPIANIFRYRLPTLYKITIGLVLACLLMSGPGFFEYLTSGDYASITGKMLAEKPYVESAREFLGASFALAVLFSCRDWHSTSGEA